MIVLLRTVEVVDLETATPPGRQQVKPDIFNLLSKIMSCSTQHFYNINKGQRNERQGEGRWGSKPEISRGTLS